MLFLIMTGCGNGLHDVNNTLEKPGPLVQTIELSDGLLDSRFDPRKTDYEAAISEAVVSFTVRATVHKGIESAIASGDAFLTINGSDYVPGAYSEPFGLDVWNYDNNIVEIYVYSYGKARIYSIKLNPQPVTDETFRDVPDMVDDGTGDQKDVTFDGKYREDLANHPGCVKRSSYDANTGFFTDIYGPNEADVPAGNEADIPGYPCAAKEYVVDEDLSKPIVILVHSFSDSINVWEEYYNSNDAGRTITTQSGYQVTFDLSPREMLAQKLVSHGFRVYAVDFRTDLVSTLTGFNQANYKGRNYINPNYSIDYGWAVPILQSLIKAIINNNIERKISIVAHSSGSIVVRDALRRLFNNYIDNKSMNPWLYVKNLIYLNAPNHGTGINPDFCNKIFSMYMTGGCQIGLRSDLTEERTPFSLRLNGYNDKWSTPCGDGINAFGMTGYCGDNTIQYSTIAISDDLSNGNIRDEILSEKTIKLNSPFCDNIVLDTSSYDSSGYFFGGIYANHFAGARSEKGMDIILQKLLD